ncbi:hypothetical protein ACNVED_08340 [Legionella sp. D16C41]|uniref:hypothetical protein n=1 Tax=Legionella sp. D16C41 TaxID=3402688 RepID=UPI003AF5B424
MKKLTYGLLLALVSSANSIPCFALDTDLQINNESNGKFTIYWGKKGEFKDIGEHSNFRIKTERNEYKVLYIEILTANGNRRPYTLISDNFCDRAIITIQDDVLPNRYITHKDLSQCETA